VTPQRVLVIKNKKEKEEYRSRMSIISCILENSKNISKNKEVQKACKINNFQTNIYRNYLVDAGLLIVKRSNKSWEIFKTTRKGREFLKDFKLIKRTLKSIAR
jgi:predicted transcriptional regulator